MKYILVIGDGMADAPIAALDNKTPLEYLTELRMERARQLIISSSMRIKDIAEWCGYTDSYYFSRCFKKYYGVSPEMFRSSLTTNCSGPIPERRTLLDE